MNTTQQAEALPALIERFRGLHFDHAPDGWPAVRTREITALLARITELESQLAQRFDAADVATASAQGFRDGVASVSAGSEPVAWQYRGVRDKGLWFDCTEERAQQRAAHPDKWDVRYLYTHPSPPEGMAGWRPTSEMRAVVAVAVTMLYDTHPEDVLRVFDLCELEKISSITMLLGSQKVEDIYRSAWDHLTSGAADLPEALTEYLEAQDALDNREYAGINAEPYEKLVRSRNHARAALESALAAGQATAAQAVVPAGWKLVPVDATDEMVRATDEVNFENGDTDGTIHNVWHVMIAAAPAQPAAQQGAAYAALPDEGEPWRGHKFKEVQRGCWRCDCGKTIKEVTSDQSTPASGGNYPVMPKRYTVDDDGEELFTAEKMRAFADATHTLRASHGQAPAGAAEEIDKALNVYAQAFAARVNGWTRQNGDDLPGARSALFAAIHAYAQASTRPTTSPQAESVLEDAAREAIEKVLALFPFNVPIQKFSVNNGPCLTADNDDEFYSVKRVLAFLTEIKTTLDAARKQGANHDR